MRILVTLALVLAGPLDSRADEFLTGHNFQLTRSLDGSSQNLIVTSKDPTTTLGGRNFSPDDPVVHQATMYLGTHNGDHVTELSSGDYGGWRYIGSPGADRGYRYRNPAYPGLSIKVVPGKGIAVRYRRFTGPNLLSERPNAVTFRLTLGGYSYCLGFGGQQKFAPNRWFKAKGADAPTDCS